jgi:hypothetical protein
LLHHDGCGSPGGSLGGEPVSVEIFTPERQKEIARLQFARVGADARHRLAGVVPVQRAVRPLGDLLECRGVHNIKSVKKRITAVPNNHLRFGPDLTAPHPCIPDASGASIHFQTGIILLLANFAIGNLHRFGLRGGHGGI